MFNGPSSKLNITGMIKKNHSQKKYDYLFEGGSAGCTYVMDKSLIIKIKQILNTIDYVNWKYFSHDWFIYFIARNNGFKVFIDSESFIYYRIHENNAHGHLNALSIKSVIKKANLFNNGWYINQINGFQKLLKHNSVEFKIYQSFKKNWLLRIFIIFRFNFNLIRNPTKFFQFVILNFLSVKKHI
jgi:rhamnosyltransferase